MAHLVASISETVNWYHLNIATTVVEYAWLSFKHLKIPPPLSHKLAAHFAGLFPVLCAIGPFLFSYSYQMTGPFITYFIQVILGLLLVLWMLWILVSTLKLTTPVNLNCRTF